VAVYFQKVRDDQFNAETGFVVKESKNMRLFIGLIALGIAVIMAKSSILIAAVIAVFAIATLLASRRNKTVMTINKEGFFYEGNLITSWRHFVSAKFLDQTPQLSKSSLGVSDQFYLAVRYRKEGDKACYEQKIPLTNLQDKSEEEIMAAVRFFYNHSLGLQKPSGLK
jgi:hypothetical protein